MLARECYSDVADWLYRHTIAVKIIRGPKSSERSSTSAVFFLPCDVQALCAPTPHWSVYQDELTAITMKMGDTWGGKQTNKQTKQ